MQINNKIFIIFIIIGLLVVLYLRGIMFKNFYMQDLAEIAINNAVNGIADDSNRDNLVIKFRFDNTLSEKENILAFLRTLDCEYVTDEESIPLDRVLAAINDVLIIGKKKKDLLRKSVRIGSSFTAGDYEVELLSYSPSGKEKSYSFIEILYTNDEELVFSRVFGYGKIVDFNCTKIASCVEKQFKLAMNIQE